MKIKAIAIFLSVLIIGNAYAANSPGSISFTIAESYAVFDLKRHLDNAWIPNLALAYNFDTHWAVEAEAGLINTERCCCCYRGCWKHSVHGYSYNVDGIYRFTPYRLFQPYVEAGVGVLSLKPNGNDNTQQGNINAAIGTQFHLNKIVSLRAEIRDLYTFVGSKNDLMFSLGLSFSSCVL